MSGGPYGFSLPEILGGIQQERSTLVSRIFDARAYSREARVRMDHWRFRLGEDWDALLERLGL